MPTWRGCPYHPPVSKADIPPFRVDKTVRAAGARKASPARGGGKIPDFAGGVPIVAAGDTIIILSYFFFILSSFLPPPPSGSPPKPSVSGFGGERRSKEVNGAFRPKGENGVHGLCDDADTSIYYLFFILSYLFSSSSSVSAFARWYLLRFSSCRPYSVISWLHSGGRLPASPYISSTSTSQMGSFRSPAKR